MSEENKDPIDLRKPDPAPDERRATDLPLDAPWWARWLDANVKEAYKWASVWWPAFCIAAIEVWAQLPAEQQQQAIDALMSLIPATFRPHALAGVFAASIVLRVLKLTRSQEQSTKSNP